MNVEPLASVEAPDWLRLRRALWPHADEAEHLAEMAGFLAEPQRFGQWIARDAAGRALGFAEASIRHDYVLGTDTSPVGFLEGLYVTPAARRGGVARALVEEAAAWTVARGCRELASDTHITNRTSRAVHARLGFEETERVVAFRRRLPPG